MKKLVDLVPWGISGVCMAASLVYPAHLTAIWVTGVLCLMPLLWWTLRQQVNYHSLEFDSQGFTFRRSANKGEPIRWSDVAAVSYVRVFNDFSNQIETEWRFRLYDGKVAKVEVEWPHRSRFRRAIIRNLKQVSPKKIGQATRERREGIWGVNQDGA